MSMVTINGVRYRVDDAKRRGLIPDNEPEPVALSAPGEPADAPVEEQKRGWWKGKGLTPKNKAATPVDK